MGLSGTMDCMKLAVLGVINNGMWGGPPSLPPQVRRHVDAVHELGARRHRQSFGHPQPHHLRHHAPQVQVGSEEADLCQRGL